MPSFCVTAVRGALASAGVPAPPGLFFLLPFSPARIFDVGLGPFAGDEPGASLNAADFLRACYRAGSRFFPEPGDLHRLVALFQDLRGLFERNHIHLFTSLDGLIILVYGHKVKRAKCLFFARIKKAGTVNN